MHCCRIVVEAEGGRILAASGGGCSPSSVLQTVDRFQPALLVPVKDRFTTP